MFKRNSSFLLAQIVYFSYNSYMDGIIFSKIREEAQFPTKATSGSACWDLYSAEDVFLDAGDTKVVRTGLVVKMPFSYMMQIYSRSGLSSKGIVVANAPGIIDSDFYPSLESDPYAFEIKIILHNNNQCRGCSDHSKGIRAGDKIAQCTFVKVDEIRTFSTYDWKNTVKLGDVPGSRIMCDPVRANWGTIGEVDHHNSATGVNYDISPCEIKDRVRDGGLGSSDLQQAGLAGTVSNETNTQSEASEDCDKAKSSTQSESRPYEYSVEEYHKLKEMWKQEYGGGWNDP